MSASPERGGGPPAKPGVEGSQRPSGGGARPLHHAAHGPPHSDPKGVAHGEELKRLDEKTLVATRQLYPADLPSLAAAGIRLIVNNRPDGEEPGQPLSAEIEAAARAAGLGYRHIPVAGGFPSDQVEAMAQALDEGPLLAFCRSGTRSTFLWALARAARGAPAGESVAAAAAAGYDLGPIRAWL